MVLISRKQIARIDFIGDLFEFAFEAVGDNDVAALENFAKSFSTPEAIEVVAVSERRFVDNNL